MGVCKVKDDNIVQAMQQAQADKVDHWAFYQARNLREELARATAVQLKLQAAGRPRRSAPATTRRSPVRGIGRGNRRRRRRSCSSRRSRTRRTTTP
jgi:hypothetical protein